MVTAIPHLIIALEPLKFVEQRFLQLGMYQVEVQVEGCGSALRLANVRWFPFRVRGLGFSRRKCLLFI